MMFPVLFYEHLILHRVAHREAQRERESALVICHGLMGIDAQTICLKLLSLLYLKRQGRMCVCVCWFNKYLCIFPSFLHYIAFHSIAFQSQWIAYSVSLLSIFLRTVDNYVSVFGKNNDNKQTILYIYSVYTRYTSLFLFFEVRGGRQRERGEGEGLSEFPIYNKKKYSIAYK